MTAIFPSLISGDLLHLAECIDQLEPYCDGFHVDIMDFHFVPNLTWGPAFANAIRSYTQKRLWVDLLVDNPQNYLDQLNLQEGDMVSIHYESSFDKSIWSDIESHGWLPGIAIDSRTAVSKITNIIERVHHVLLMSVTPGFSGQPFIPAAMDRLKSLHQLIKEMGARTKIAIDGGINLTNLLQIKKIGADYVAIASGIFSSKTPVETLKELETIASHKG